MLRFVTEAVALHIKTDPPLKMETEKKIVEEMDRAGNIMIQFQKSSTVVTNLLSRVTSKSDKDDCKSIERQLRFQFEHVLYQNNVRAEMVAPLAEKHVCGLVNAVHVVVIRQKGSIVVYFLCTTVKALLKFAHMITSGFLHAIYTEIIQSVTHTTVDVDTYVRADEFNYRLLCLTSQQDTGWLFTCLQCFDAVGCVAGTAFGL